VKARCHDRQVEDFGEAVKSIHLLCSRGKVGEKLNNCTQEGLHARAFLLQGQFSRSMLRSGVLKARSLTAGDLAPTVTVVPGAVNEIIRLQTGEGYACFRH
jgi:intracellular sulfur oxidation DsrE/DsrF family protein